MNLTTYKRHDQLPDYTATLQTGSGSSAAAIDLTDCTVRFMMTLDVKVGLGTPKVNAAATIVGDPTQGNVKHTWGSTDLDTAGEYSVEWEITYASGKKLTVPSTGYDTIVVAHDIA